MMTSSTCALHIITSPTRCMMIPAATTIELLNMDLLGFWALGQLPVPVKILVFQPSGSAGESKVGVRGLYTCSLTEINQKY